MYTWITVKSGSGIWTFAHVTLTFRYTLTVTTGFVYTRRRQLTIITYKIVVTK